MHAKFLLPLAAGLSAADAASTLLWGGTIVAFNDDTESLQIIRNGSLLVTDDRIASINTDAQPSSLPYRTQLIDVSNQIITPGFIDTHRHGWQTVFKTIGSNTALAEYFARFGEYASAASFTPEDVYISQLAGLYEALNGGVTTLLDHASHTWSNDTAYAGLNASVESGARVFWAYTFHNITSLNYTVEDQIPNFREIAQNRKQLLKESPTEVGVAYDFWGPDPNVDEVHKIATLIREYNVSVLTTHALGGPWDLINSPADLQSFGLLNGTVPIVFSHGSFFTARDAELLRSTNQYLAITPESEMHYGHGHPHSYFIQDQAALGVDTHFTYSSDILTQARIWLQSTRYHFSMDVLDKWHIPSYNSMSVNQAFLLATRAGGLAVRRPDLGVIRIGAKADLVVWNAEESPSMLGWVDPVAAVILHANVGDVLHVLVDGKFVKKDGKLVGRQYRVVRKKFLKSARKIQKMWKDVPYPTYEGQWLTSTYGYQAPECVDVLRGERTGYGNLFLD
ncbi:5-methylthioadenosine/S-adenosylhomocysteine deaminase 1-like protein [Cladobotryum mycophilum]|uniref:5-methylthioadenosine/S-adenosylhomocysteine deaminase 1-like protein n=1 Tax=Cladobotryum mycophilum TaxID=491253 RepID=A0ABR0SQ90_9HYPO